MSKDILNPFIGKNDLEYKEIEAHACHVDLCVLPEKGSNRMLLLNTPNSS